MVGLVALVVWQLGHWSGATADKKLARQRGMRCETDQLTLFIYVAINDTVFALGRWSLSRHGIDSPSMRASTSVRNEDSGLESASENARET